MAEGVEVGSKRSCMFGSIQCVHVVNMKAGGVFFVFFFLEQQMQIHWRSLLLIQVSDGTAGYT